MGKLTASVAIVLSTTLALLGCQNVPSEDLTRRFEAHMALAEGYFEVGDFERARRPLASALELQPRAWQPHWVAARIYDREGEAALAEAAFRRARRLGPAHSELRNDYGVFLFRQGRFDAAVAELEAAVQDPDFPLRAVAFENLGQALEAVGNRSGARDAFGRALALSPCLSRPLLALTRLELTEGDVPAARRYAERYARCAPDNEESLTLALAIARRLGDPDAEAEASRRLRALQESRP